MHLYPSGGRDPDVLVFKYIMLRTVALAQARSLKHFGAIVGNDTVFPSELTDCIFHFVQSSVVAND